MLKLSIVADRIEDSLGGVGILELDQRWALRMREREVRFAVPIRESRCLYQYFVGCQITIDRLSLVHFVHRFPGQIYLSARIPHRRSTGGTPAYLQPQQQRNATIELFKSKSKRLINS